MNMKTYQQIAIYVVPLLGQMQFINTVVVLVRLYWFENKFKDIGTPVSFHYSRRNGRMFAQHAKRN